MPITEQQLKEWEEIEKKATEGPWHSQVYWFGELTRVMADKVEVASCRHPEIVEFLIMARTAMPLLIKRVRELEEENMALHGLAIYPTK